MEVDLGHNSIWIVFMHHAMLLHSIYIIQCLFFLIRFQIDFITFAFLRFAIILQCNLHLSFVHAKLSSYNVNINPNLFHILKLNIDSLQPQTALKTYMRAAANLLLRDANSSLSTDEKAVIVNTFVDDVYDVEYRLAKV